MTPRLLCVCADDFGLNPGVNRALLRLAQAGRLNALSCMTNAPAWGAGAAALKALPRTVQTGLHFNLTEGVALGEALRQRRARLPGLGHWMARAAVARQADAAVAQELAAQWRAFVQALGREPDYLDGHQHVHQLAGVRQAVVARAQQAGVPVRATGHLPGPQAGLKRWVIERSGGRALTAALDAAGLPRNQVLLGAYDFQAPDYRALVRGWLHATPAQGGLLMCHPGDADPAADGIAPAREREAHYLGSIAFEEDLQAAGVTLGPTWGHQTSSAG
jgi:chitin disaccharide deacetylase